MADPDPIVAEVRRAREALARKSGFSLDAMCADARARQGADGTKVVAFPPRAFASSRTKAGRKRTQSKGKTRKKASGGL
jgi:hypothetical protein